ncbi:MAG: glycoside hydrolase, partial [Bacteroidales bacterium]
MKLPRKCPRTALAIAAMAALSAIGSHAYGQELKVTQDEYLDARGLNVLVFSSEYNGMFFDEKTAGVEIIQHGLRTSTGGAVRLQNTPEQWDLVPKVVDRRVDRENNRIEVTLRYEELGFDSKIIVGAKGKGFRIQVFLEDPVPE